MRRCESGCWWRSKLGVSDQPKRAGGGGGGCEEEVAAAAREESE